MFFQVFYILSSKFVRMITCRQKIKVYKCIGVCMHWHEINLRMTSVINIVTLASNK